MGRTFTFDVKSSVQDLLQALKTALPHAEGVEFEGDERSGRLAGRGFAGEYCLEATPTGSRVELTLSRKPLLVPWALVEATLRREAGKW